MLKEPHSNNSARSKVLGITVLAGHTSHAKFKECHCISNKKKEQ
jgi:hypothetical protein